MTLTTHRPTGSGTAGLEAAAGVAAMVVAQGGVAIVAVDADGAVLLFNDPAERLFGGVERALEVLGAPGGPIDRALGGERFEDSRLRLDEARVVAVTAGPLVEGERIAGAALFVRVLPSAASLEASLAARELEAAEARKRARILARSYASGAVVVFDRDLRLLVADGPSLARLKLTAEDLEGRTLRDVLGDEDAYALVAPHYEGALEGRSSARETTREGRTFRVDYRPIYGEDGQVVGGLASAQDVTDLREAEERLARTERKVRGLFEAPLLGLVVTDFEGRVCEANDAFLRMVGYDRSDLEAGALNWRAMTPPEWQSANARAIEEVKATGWASPFEKEYFRKDGARVPVLVGSTHLADVGENVTFVLDLTEKRSMELELERQHRIAKALTDNATFGLVMMDERQHCTFMNPAAEALFGVTMEEVRALDRPLHDIVHSRHPDGRPYPIDECPIDRALPKRMQERGEDVFVRPDGTFYPVAFTASPFLENGVAVGTVIEVRETTEERRLEQSLRDEAEALDVLHELGKRIAGELDLERVVGEVTDAATRLSGAQFGAFFYNVIDEAGERFTLYTLSGAPREAFSKFPMPRNTKVFAPTFLGEGVVRVDDITQDPRYGHNAPHHGMPAGHLPVRSYLAVPVISRSGEVLGGLFFGHGEPGRFDARAERIVTGLATHAAIAMDNAELYRAERRAAVTAEHERQRLKRLLIGLPAGVAVSWGREHRFEWANEVYGVVAGRDVAGQTVREAFPELEGQPIFGMLDRVYDTGVAFEANEMLVPLDRDGDGVPEPAWFDFVYQPILDVDGKSEGILVFCIEVTDQVSARRRVEALASDLQRSEAFFRRVSETIPQMVFTLTPEGAVDFANARLVSYLGRSAEDIRLEGWVDHIHDDDRARALTAWQCSLESGGAYEVEYRIRSKDGTYGWHLSRTLAVRDGDGRIARWFGTLTDITEQRRAAEERERLISALEKSNRDLDQFAYVASHDLKAPLRGIASLSQWIEEDLGEQMTDDARRQMGLLRGRVHRLEALINGILEYSRAGRMVDKQEPVDARRMVLEVWELLSPPREAVLDLATPLPQLVTGRVPLQQVWMNLIGNAIKYAGREDVRVTVSAEAHGDFWRFSVADDGPGIAPEFHERIWGIFQTLSARDKVEGTGIGLSVVRKIIESRGGLAWVESRPGAGATFHFTWPRREAPPP